MKERRNSGGRPNFTKDFNRNPLSRQIEGKERMKVAALLWKKVRDHPGATWYSSVLLLTYMQERGLGI